jgi:hypothetical protein
MITKYSINKLLCQINLNFKYENIFLFPNLNDKTSIQYFPANSALNKKLLKLQFF